MDTTKRRMQVWLLIAGIFITSFISFALAGAYFMRKQKKEHITEVKALHQELQDLEVSIVEMENILDSKDVELDMKDQLLEEKNIELGYLTVKVNKLQETQQGNHEEMEQIKAQLAEARVQIREAFAQLDHQKQVEGLVYRVQIGAMPPESAFPAPVMDSEAFEVEYTEGFHKYLVGSFRSYEASLSFRNMIQKMGIKGAWIIPYMDGKRLEGTEAKQYLPETPAVQLAHAS